MIDELRAAVIEAADRDRDVDALLAGVGVAELRQLATALRKESYDDRAAALVLRHALALATGDDYLAVAIELAGALEQSIELDEARAVLAEAYARTPGDRFAMRMRAAEVLATFYSDELVLDELRGALDDASCDDDRVAAATELVAACDDVPAVFERWIVLAEQRLAAQPSAERATAVVRMRFERSHHDTTDRMDHARVAAELAREWSIADHRYITARWYAWQLCEAGSFADAEAWLLAAIQPDDPPDALLDEIRRGLGTLAEDVPLDELVVDTPRGEIEPKLWEYFAPPSDDPVANLARYGAFTSSDVLEWSSGVVRCEADLTSEVVFGPLHSYICTCRRYRGRRYRGAVCERCRVEIIPSHQREIRAGHISFDVHVPHPWLLGPIAMMLGTTRRELRDAYEADPAATVTRIEDFHDRPWDLEERLVHMAPGPRRDKVEQLLALSRVRDDNVMVLYNACLSAIPVLPPETDLGPDIEPERLRGAYVRVLDERSLRSVESLFRIFAGVLD